jgi:hypothetical protein
MTPKRIHHLPPNLTLDQPSGRYRFRNPVSGARTWFGRDRATAIERAKQANQALALIKIQRDLQAGMPLTVGALIDLYVENIADTKPWDDGTRHNHLFALRLYQRAFGERALAGVDRVFLGDWLSARCPSADAYNKHRARLIDLWRYAISRKWCHLNEAACTLPRSTSRKLPANRKLRKHLSLEQFWAFRTPPRPAGCKSPWKPPWSPSRPAPRFAACAARTSGAATSM